MSSIYINKNIISDEIKLRNTYANKIINKFKKSINLLSEINSHILKKQKGSGSTDSVSKESVPVSEESVSELLNNGKRSEEETNDLIELIQKTTLVQKTISDMIDQILPNLSLYKENIETMKSNINKAELNRTMVELEMKKLIEKYKNKYEEKNNDEDKVELEKQIKYYTDKITMLNDIIKQYIDNELSANMGSHYENLTTLLEKMSNVKSNLAELNMQSKQLNIIKPIASLTEGDHKTSNQSNSELPVIRKIDSKEIDNRKIIKRTTKTPWEKHFEFQLSQIKPGKKP